MVCLGYLTFRIKPSISLDLLKTVLHYSTYEETVTGLQGFGLEFTMKRSGRLSEADYQAITIPSVDGLKSMKNHQMAEKGTKLL